MEARTDVAPTRLVVNPTSTSEYNRDRGVSSNERQFAAPFSACSSIRAALTLLLPHPFATPPQPADVIQQFTQLVGTQELPPMFALGYHQCRWNYKDQKDVAQVHGMFEELNFP